eukprot:2579721-Prymnesium_polylepis.3
MHRPSSPSTRALPCCMAAMSKKRTPSGASVAAVARMVSDARLERFCGRRQLAAWREVANIRVSVGVP